jgi:hypothetical protein
VTIASNATNGAPVVTLKAEAAKAGRDGEDNRDAVTNGSEGGGMFGEVGSVGTSEVGSVAIPGVLLLRQSTPNPASAVARISYQLNQGSAVMLRLYNDRGEEVKVLDAGTRSAGNHEVVVDVSSLTVGVYHYRLEVGGRSLSRSLHVTR